MKKVEPNKKKVGFYGFQFIERGNRCELFTNDKNLYTELGKIFRNFCLQSDFYEKFTITKALGRGAFATVSQVMHLETEKIYAAKIFKKENFSKKSNLLVRDSIIHILTPKLGLYQE